MSNRLPIDPLWQPKAQSLKPRDLKRVRRHTLSAFTRAAPYPLDTFRIEQRHRRNLLVLDIVFCVLFGIAGLCLVLAALQLW